MDGLARNHHSPPSTSCCTATQLCFSYILCLLSSSIMAYGTIIFFQTQNNLWLVVPGSGFLLTLIGASIYKNGVLNSNRNNRYKSKRSRHKRSARESHIFESHLSINMLPQCFTSLDINNSNQTSIRPRSITANSQRYLMLPIDATATPETTINDDDDNNHIVDIVQSDTHQVESPCSTNETTDVLHCNPALTDHSLNDESTNTTANDQSTQNNDFINDDLIVDPTINEAPPSYEEVIDIELDLQQSSPPTLPSLNPMINEHLVDNLYRTL